MKETRRGLIKCIRKIISIIRQPPWISGKIGAAKIGFVIKDVEKIGLLKFRTLSTVLCGCPRILHFAISKRSSYAP